MRSFRARWVATIGAALFLAGCGGGGDHASSGCQALPGAGTAVRKGLQGPTGVKSIFRSDAWNIEAWDVS